MNPRPIVAHMEAENEKLEPYKAAGKLKEKIALITGGEYVNRERGREEGVEERREWEGGGSGREEAVKEGAKRERNTDILFAFFFLFAYFSFFLF